MRDNVGSVSDEADDENDVRRAKDHIIKAGSKHYSRDWDLVWCDLTEQGGELTEKIFGSVLRAVLKLTIDEVSDEVASIVYRDIKSRPVNAQDASASAGRLIVSPHCIDEIEFIGYMRNLKPSTDMRSTNGREIATRATGTDQTVEVTPRRIAGPHARRPRSGNRAVRKMQTCSGLHRAMFVQALGHVWLKHRPKVEKVDSKRPLSGPSVVPFAVIKTQKIVGLVPKKSQKVSPEFDESVTVTGKKISRGAKAVPKLKVREVQKATMI